MEHWYALYTRPRHEKKVFDQMVEKKLEVFLPLVPRVRVWKDRKKTVDLPLFTSYLFARFDYRDRFRILATHGIVKIINFKGVPAVVPDWQISALRKMLEHPETLRLETFIKPGQIVEITEGPFRGLRGMVKSLRGETRLIISVEGIMQSVSVEIESAYIKTLKWDEQQEALQ